MREKKNELDSLFRTVLDLPTLKHICYGGIPEEYRPTIWRVLLGHHSPTTPEKRTKSYLFLKNESHSTANEALRVKDGHQIKLDLKRTRIEHVYFNGINLMDVFSNILITFAHNNPLIGYVQGMSDILTVFVHVFAAEGIEDAEPNAYFTFTSFIERIGSNYVCNQPGITEKIEWFERIITIIEPALSRNLLEKGLHAHLYAYRWFNCYFCREFEMSFVFKIFDSALSFDDLHSFSVFLGVSIVLFFKEKLMTLSFEASLVFLQNLNRYGWKSWEVERVLNNVFIIKKRMTEGII